MNLSHRLCVFTALLLFLSPALTARGENRIALLMGVGAYDGNFGLKALPGISTDLQHMKAALERVGFRITVVENPALLEAEEAIEKFAEELAKSNGVALFYFSGHGGEFEGKNYLIPRGARIGKPRDVKEQAVAAHRVLGRMEEARNKTNIVFLDCCRNDMAKAASDSGMAAMNAKGTFIGFATASEKVSLASTAGSPYTISLAKHIPQQGLSITDMHTKVTREVEQMTGGEGDEGQTPFQYSGLRDVFYFVPANGYVPPPVAETRPARPNAAEPAPAPNPPPAVQKDDFGIKAFFSKWWDHQASDEASVWASDFTSPCDYSAPDRVKSASRAYITDDRSKLLRRYYRRIYTLLEDPSFSIATDRETAKLNVRFGYRYDGVKRTEGSAHVILGLVKEDSAWRISSYVETVARGEIKPGGGQNADSGNHGGGGNAAGARAALGKFVESWWAHQTFDNAATWAGDFRNPCDYCYGEGRSSRKFIQQDRQKLLNRYTQRVIRPVIQPDVTLANDETTAAVRMVYTYAYSGAKNASGTATVNLSLNWDGSSWGITRYTEKTRRD